MAVIEKFLGRQVTLPDNLRYFVKQGLWARLDKSAITFGFSEPALTLSGGIQDLNFLAEDGETVDQGQSYFLRLPASSFISIPRFRALSDSTLKRKPIQQQST